MMRKYRVKINGMTCTRCEQHIDTVLTSIGGKNIETSFQRGESVFELPDGINAEKVKQEIKQAKYQTVEIDEISSQKPKKRSEEHTSELQSRGHLRSHRQLQKK